MMQSAEIARSQEWISVETKMPDLGQHVLLYAESYHTQVVGFLRPTETRGVLTKGRYWHVAHNTQKGQNWPLASVTHWMPLPAPPRPRARRDEGD